MKYGNLDGQGIAELRNYNIQNLSSAPTSNLKKGRIYFNTTDNTLYVYNGTEFVDALAQGRIYVEGTGIDITGSTISIDDTIVATKNFVSSTYVPQTRTINSKPLNNNIILNADDVDAVPTSRKINNKALTNDISLDNSDVGALADTTKYGASIDLSLNTTDYKLTLTLKDQDGTTLNTKTVDFPIESVVVGGSYDSTNKKIVLTLQNGNTIDVPVGDLISGLQSEITTTNKLSSDLVDDSTSSNKFVSSAQRTQIGTNATNINTLLTTTASYGDIVTHNTSEFATASQGAKADTAMQRYTVNNSAITVSSSGIGAFVVTHNLNTTNPIVNVYEVATGEKVMYDVVVTSANVVTINILSANNIPADTYNAVVIG